MLNQKTRNTKNLPGGRASSPLGGCRMCLQQPLGVGLRAPWKPYEALEAAIIRAAVIVATLVVVVVRSWLSRRG